jgi:hypothetical protein
MPPQASNGESRPAHFITDEQREQFVRDGFVRVSGLIPARTVESTRQALADGLGLDEADPRTWEGKPTTVGDLWKPTVACKTEEMYRAAEELVGPDYSRDPRDHSPYREAQGLDPWMEGFIPVLRYPVAAAERTGEPKLAGWHMDGMKYASFWPKYRYLVVFIYLVDVSARGGATVVRPGSHRQLFEHGYPRCQSDPDAIVAGLPDLPYQPPVALEGQAGDVLFMHYLLGHSGAANHDDHIRYGLNGSISVDRNKPYQRRPGAPEADWTPLDYTLRVDNLPAPAAASATC